jgi:hypothetical protein
VLLFENESLSVVRTLFNDAAAAGKMIIVELFVCVIHRKIRE